jgi:hypothetical protein
MLGFHFKIDYDEMNVKYLEALIMKGKKGWYIAIVVVIIMAAVLDILFKGLGYQLLQKLF